MSKHGHWYNWHIVREVKGFWKFAYFVLVNHHMRSPCSTSYHTLGSHSNTMFLLAWKQGWLSRTSVTWLRGVQRKRKSRNIFTQHVTFKILVVEYDVPYFQQYKLPILDTLNPQSHRYLVLPIEHNVIAHPKVVGNSCCRFRKNINQRCLVQHNARRDCSSSVLLGKPQNQAHKSYTMHSSAMNTCK